MKLSEILAAASLPPMLLGLVVALSMGCDSKEKVIDVETPRANIEVERDTETGKVDVDVNRKDEQVLDSDVPGADVEVQRDKETGDVEIK